MDTMEGATVGAYEVKTLLGKGGMGEVYLAEHTLLGRRVAIKFLLGSLSTDEELVGRLFTEAKATTAVADPGIVQVFDFGYHTDGKAYIVMEYLEGQSLDDRLAAGTFPERIALHLARHLANALGAAHRAGVIHRDLKLENVFLVSDPAVTGGERPKILDFGLAKVARPEPGRAKTRSGVIMGTPIYMSPEQCKGAHDVDERSDLYSLGCVLYTMVIGRPPFDYESAGELIAAHLREAPPVPSAKCDDLTADFDHIIARCLAKDPAERFQSAAELARAITDALADTATISQHGLRSRRLTGEPARASTQLARPTTLSSAVGTTSYPTVPPPRRSRLAIGGLLVVCVGLATFVGVSVLGEGWSPGAPAAAAGVIAPAPAAPEVTPVPAAAEVTPVPAALTTPTVDDVDVVREPAAPPVIEAPAPVARPAKRARPPARRVAPRRTIAPVAGSAGTRNAGNMDRGD